MSAPTLPAYLRLPDGLRLSGTVAVDGAGVLNFAPKQALSMVPPAGLPVDVVVAGLPDDDEGQVRVPGSIDTANARLITLDPDDPLPATLLACLAPGGSAAPVNATASPQQAAGARPEGIFEEVCADGIDRMGKSMRRFLVDLGDHLFDLATSARYGSAGRHRHYDALNQLKRASIDLIQDFQDRLRDTLNNPLKDQQERTFADLEGTSAQSLGLVAVEEVEQKLAIEKIVTSVLDKHRIALECLTIRTAMLRNVDAQRARTPFHPAHVINAFLSSLEAVTSDAEVNKDIIGFFGQRFTRELDSLYPALNGALIAAGIEPDLEQRIEKTGSILHPPPEKRIVKSAPPEVEEEPDPAQAPPSRAQARVAARAAPPEEGAPSEAAAGGGSGEPAARARAGAGAGAAQKHDAIYDAVLAALDSQRTRASADALAGAPAPGDVAGGEPSAAPSAEGRAVAPSPGAMAGAGTAAAGDAAPEGAPLDQLPPLNELLRDSADAGDGAVELNPDSANRLNFVDNVFRTLQRNFEVSEDMAPSLARLRVPLARLSLQEPKFFTQPAHPAHRMLDKLSTLASSDHTISRSLQKKVEEIVDRIAENYDTDSSVFDEAQQELDALVGQKNTLLDKNIERVISALRGRSACGRPSGASRKPSMNTLTQTRCPRHCSSSWTMAGGAR